MKIKEFAILLFLITCLFSCQEESHKIWLHRANDIEKAQYFQDKYSGLEIDLTYVDSLQTFLILHGGGHHEPNPITFEQWLDRFESTKNLKLWLDFKNLNKENMTSSLDELDRICLKYVIKPKNLIVESWAASCLPAFQDAGYQISFYIPSFKPQETSAEKIQKYTDEIRKATTKNNINIISGYYYQYEFMRDSFPEKNILIWYNLYDSLVREKYIELANDDDKVKVLLVADEIPIE